MLWATWGQNMMSHIYERLAKNTISEAGSVIPGHTQDQVMPVMEESSRFLVGERWGVGSCWLLQGKREAELKQRFIYNSCFTIRIQRWHCWYQLESTGFCRSVPQGTCIFLCSPPFYVALYTLERTNAATAGLSCHSERIWLCIWSPRPFSLLGCSWHLFFTGQTRAFDSR